MTLENSKRLFEHYSKIKYTKALKDILKKYPQFKEKPVIKSSKNAK